MSAMWPAQFVHSKFVGCGVPTRPMAGTDRFGRGYKATVRRSEMEFLKRILAMPKMKYGLLTLGSGAWAFGLVDQLSSSAATMKYLLMSLLMVVVAVL